MRGWDQGRQPTPDGEYQAPCGHYLRVGHYACSPCNIAPLELLQEACNALRQQRARSPLARTVLDQVEAALR